jgi:plastocyanin
VHRKFVLLALGAALVSGGAPKAPVVTISGFQYRPDHITIYVGDEIEWRNTDIVPHTATCLDGRTFNSGSIAPGASWRYKALRKGSFEYECTLHPNMKAKLTVE